VTLKKCLVDGDALNRHDALESLHLNHFIDQQKRVPVRQEFLYFVDVQLHARSRAA
jgi:hypothetical protein